MSTEPQTQPDNADAGFGDALSGAAEEFKDWTPNDATNDERPDKNAIDEAAEKVGFTSREPKAAPAAEPETSAIFSMRAKTAVIDEFKAFANEQEPKWPQGYVLERALAALKRELAE